jgi:hypothetical protein
MYIYIYMYIHVYLYIRGYMDTRTVWMFFGIISFGVFSGNVSGQIALSAMENAIASPSDLSSFTVGVLATLASPKVENMDLGKHVCPHIRAWTLVSTCARISEHGPW